MNEKKTKIGILKYIASTGARGVKFEDQPETWYNPSSDEAKEMVNNDFKGKQVEIVLADGKKTEFVSMVLLEDKIKLTRPKATTAEALPHEEVITEVEDGPEDIEEEKVLHQTPSPKEEEPIMSYNFPEGSETIVLGNIIHSISCEAAQEYTQEDYREMENTKLETAKKGPMKLTYASWAEVWGALKRIHPRAQYTVHENNEGMPYFYNEKVGAFVKVSVTVKEITHTMILPVMNHFNKSAKIEELDSFLINKNIMRCLVKAVALHGIGLYVFKGEDYPEETSKKE